MIAILILIVGRKLQANV